MLSNFYRFFNNIICRDKKRFSIIFKEEKTDILSTLLKIGLMLNYIIFPFILIITSSLCIFINPIWAIAPFIWVLIIVPIIDYFLFYLNKPDNKLNETQLHNFALIIILPGIFFSFLLD